jgi:hypothetical protein
LAFAGRATKRVTVNANATAKAWFLNLVIKTSSIARRILRASPVSATFGGFWGHGPQEFGRFYFK